MKKHENIAYYTCGMKGHLPYNYVYVKYDSSLFKKIWVPKGSHILTNHKGPIKVWVPKSSK